MISLLDLPGEIFHQIFVFLIRDHGLQIAVLARGVCRSFNSEIVHAMWSTRALESPNRLTRDFVDNPLLVEYLWLRTKTDTNHQYGLTTKIHDAIKLVTRLAQEAVPPEAKLLREACLAIVQARRTPRYVNRRPRQEPFDILIFEPRPCSTAVNALAFAAHLGLVSVVQRLLNEGVYEIQSDFGYATHRMVEQKTTLLTTLYLKMKLDLSLRRAKTSTLGCTVMHVSEVRQCNKVATRRGIPCKLYDSTIRHAVRYGVIDTVKLLVEALCDDHGELNHCCSEPFRTGGIAPNCGKGLRIAIQNVILIHATIEGRVDMAEMALDNGANPDRRVRTPWTFDSVLSAAARTGRLQIFNLLLSRGADLWAKLKQPLLSYAVTGGSLDIVKLCLDSGMTNFSHSRSLEDDYYEHPLLLAMCHKRRGTRHGMLQLLIAYGVTVDPESELDHKLCEVATLVGDDQALALLEQMRKEQKALALLQETTTITQEMTPLVHE